MSLLNILGSWTTELILTSQKLKQIFGPVSLLKHLFKKDRLNPDQKIALEALKSQGNVFLTGPAGVGKSHVIKTYIRAKAKRPPILASTGAAAVQIDGRTLHSFFGLGIMEGGLLKTVERAKKNPRIRERLKINDELVIDEISMIHPHAFEAAEAIAREIRGSTAPFGGLRLILTGDFLQLPPVDRFAKRIPWLFEHPLWSHLAPKKIELLKSMRTEDQSFVDILNKIRRGQRDSTVDAFLDSRVAKLTENFQGTVLFGRKAEAESYNHSKLDGIAKAPLEEFVTEVIVKSHITTPKQTLIGYSPLPEILLLKKGALIMIRKNDPDGEYVNGSLGKVKKFKPDYLLVELLSGREVQVPKEDFHVLDGDGATMATIRNFPVTLGWATTIHKSQGASIDSLHVNLRGLWEYGQAYVALSRARNPQGLYIEEWTPGSIKADPRVLEFYD